MYQARDERFGDWHLRVGKARLVWFALAQKTAFRTTPEADPFAQYGAADDYHFELGTTAEEALANIRRTVRLEG